MFGVVKLDGGELIVTFERELIGQIFSHGGLQVFSMKVNKVLAIGNE